MILHEPDDEALAWLRELAAETLVPTRLDSLVAQINTSVTAQVPEVSADHELRRDLDASSRDQSRAFLTWMSQEGADVAPPAAAHALARTIARRGLHLRTLIQIYRAGHQAILGYQAEIAGSHDIDPALELRAMLHISERASYWLNITLEILTDAYMDERERGLQSKYAYRRETVQAILRGELVDAGTASSRLGYPVNGFNTALVLSTDEVSPSGDDDSTAALENAVQLFGTAIGAHRALSVISGSRGLWAWLSCEVAPDATTIKHTFARHCLNGLHIAVGDPGPELAGFRLSHQQALAAQAASECHEANPSLIHYADIEIAHLLSGQPDAARTLVLRELRGLTGTDSTSVELRDTLHTYLGGHRSPEVAARKLGVHKNTVRYRINKIEEILGHPITDSNRLKLEIALEYSATYGF